MIKRFVKSILDKTFVPLFSYGFDPLLKRAIAHAGLAQEARLRASQASIRREIDALRRQIAVDTPGNPCAYGFKAFAQTDEDGIIEHILDKIPSHSRTFIEIGCGRGIENNTHYLALKGYAGCWVDGSISNIEFIKRELGGLEFDRLLVENRFVSVENIAEIVKRSCLWLGTTEPAFFSLDIDGNDLHVMKVALRYFKPAVVCAEYNSKFPPPLSITMPYAADFGWAGDDYHGASLQAFCDMLEEYKLVACNLTGANAFFVRREWATVFPNFTPKQLFQPFRESLIDLRSEHAPSMKWLRDKLRNQGSGDGKPALDVGTEQGGENNSGHNSTVSDS